MQQPSGAGGRRQTAVITCPKSMVGRVIGRNGETIKALQMYTGALIQIDQTCDPTKIAISGTAQSLNLAFSMVHDIVRGTFKGFALLRQATGLSSRGSHQLSTKPVYAPGYGLIPPSQLYGSVDPAAVIHSAPAGGAGGALVGAPRGLGAVPAGAAAYPQLLTSGPLDADPQQYVLGLPPMQVGGVAGSTVHEESQSYNAICSPGFGAPIYLSPATIDYSTATASGSQPLGHLSAAAPGNSANVVFYADGSCVLSASGTTGSRFFRGGVAAGGGGAAAAAGVQHGLGGAGTEGSGLPGGQSLIRGLMRPFAVLDAVGGNHHSMAIGMAGGSQAAAGGGAAQALLQPGSLVMDAKGTLYTYTMDG